MTASEYWKQRLGQDPKSDTDKLAVAMMAEYGEYHAKEQPSRPPSHSELIAFASDIVGHDEETIRQMYNDWSKYRRI